MHSVDQCFDRCGLFDDSGCSGFDALGVEDPVLGSGDHEYRYSGAFEGGECGERGLYVVAPEEVEEDEIGTVLQRGGDQIGAEERNAGGVQAGRAQRHHNTFGE